MIRKEEYIIASACLCGFKCRYDGKSKDNQKIIKLMRQSKVLPICPEVMFGMPTPRPAASIDSTGKIIENETKKDVTNIYNQAAQVALKLSLAFKAKIAFLKKGSPTCGENGCFTHLIFNKGISVYFKDTDKK